MRLRPLSRVEYGIVAGVVGFVLLAGLSPMAAGGVLLLAWAAGPLSVCLSLGGLVLGRFGSDAIPQLLVGVLCSLLWLLGAVAVTINALSGGLRGLLYAVTVVFDVLALGAGVAAIRRGRSDGDDDSSRVPV